MKATLLFLLCASLAALNPCWAESRPPTSSDSLDLPAGAEIVIRTDEAIDSRSASAGQRYSAAIEQEVLGPSGEALIPKGSPARLVIRQVSGGGTTGTAGLTLDLDSVTVQGRQYDVSTSDIERSGKQGIGKNRRTAEMVGGGAALGTLLGAVAGGGKGALIGAIAGAAAGGTAQVLTRGKEVRVPAETTLRFKLEQPLRLHSRS